VRGGRVDVCVCVCPPALRFRNEDVMHTRNKEKERERERDRHMSTEQDGRGATEQSSSISKPSPASFVGIQQSINQPINQRQPVDGRNDANRGKKKESKL
jgi:hypothetical protein